MGGQAVGGEGARLDAGCHGDGDCEVGAGAHLGPGVMLLDRPRLPGSEPGRPARVVEGARVGGGAVVCNTVGRDAPAGEVVEDDVPDGGVWMGGRVAAEF